MSPILGIWASQNYTRITGSYESIASASGGGTQIIFSSIPSTYKHLQIRFCAAITSGNQGCTMKFNSDTTATNYYRHAFVGGAGGVGTDAANSFIYTGPSVLISNVNNAGIIDILDYANTNKYKVTRELFGLNSNGGADEVGIYSGLWKNTNAIDTIVFQPNYGAAWTSTTTFSLYGIKG